ncbi:MAG: NUDIX domain-containing protein [Clostridia bacterium]|nr:NUDIX domain-containing protein [Clostridia bacterium]
MVRIGNKVDGVKYTKRFASYVIIERKEDKKIAIATDGTYFLLGGGIENNETEIEALEREVIEESGYSMKNIQYFDKITAWADGVKRGPLDVTATIYVAEFDEKVVEPIEKTHKVLWVNPEEYVGKLFHEYQRYVLDEYIKGR